jgi:hypothetical protein
VGGVLAERTFPNEPVGFDALPGWIWEVGEKQDANLRHALRIAKPNAAERIAFEIDQGCGRVAPGGCEAR